MVEYHPDLRAQLAQDRWDRLASDYRLAQRHEAAGATQRLPRLTWPVVRPHRRRHRHAPALHH